MNQLISFIIVSTVILSSIISLNNGLSMDGPFSGLYNPDIINTVLGSFSISQLFSIEYTIEGFRGAHSPKLIWYIKNDGGSQPLSVMTNRIEADFSGDTKTLYCGGDGSYRIEIDGKSLVMYKDGEQCATHVFSKEVVPLNLIGTKFNFYYGDDTDLWLSDINIKRYQLILGQKDASVATFSSNVRNTYLENENNPDANTFTNIGDLNPSDFKDSDGYYQFKLVYTNLHDSNADKSVDNDLSVTLEWKQTSWLTEKYISGYTPINVPTQTNFRYMPSDFKGLGLSSVSSAFLDGDAHGHSNWFNSVGTINTWSGGIPAFNEQVAMTAALYIYQPFENSEILYENAGPLDPQSEDLLTNIDMTDNMFIKMDILVQSFPSSSRSLFFIGDRLARVPYITVWNPDHTFNLNGFYVSFSKSGSGRFTNTLSGSSDKIELNKVYTLEICWDQTTFTTRTSGGDINGIYTKTNTKPTHDNVEEPVHVGYPNNDIYDADAIITNLYIGSNADCTQPLDIPTGCIDKEISLTDMDATNHCNNCWGGYQINCWPSYVCNPMPMGDGNQYAEYIVIHPPVNGIGFGEYALDGKYKRFTGIIGIANAGNRCSTHAFNFDFQIKVDGVLKYQSADITLYDQTEFVDIDVTNGQTLRIETSSNGHNACDQAVIAAPTLSLCGESSSSLVYPDDLTEPEPFDHNDGYRIEISKPVFLAILGLIAAVIVMNIMMIWCIKGKNNNVNKGYGVVKHVDSDSEYA